MFRTVFILLLPLFVTRANAQNPATVIQLATKEIVLPCASTCTSITATIPNIKQTDDYVVQAIPYQPFAYANGGTELQSLYADDIYSSAIALPFPVCFYGATYNSLVVGSNGIVTFDVTNAGKRNNFRQTISPINLTPVLIPYAGGNQNSLASTYYPKTAIMGVYHDIFPFNNDLRRIEWRIEGAAPKRRFIASYKDVPMYSCTSLSATHQLVIYESTGVVEVYVQDKPICTAWNEGLAILGMQNFTRNKAVFPAGKNTGKWGSMGMNEAYRFIPSAGISKFKKAELLLDGKVVALADTAAGTTGTLNLNFDKICPIADSTQYIMRVTYSACNNAATGVSFDDTVIVRKEKLDVELDVKQPTCTTKGEIVVNATGTSSQLLYSLNGGPTQTSPRFSNLTAGDYEVSISTATCTKTATTTLTLDDDLLLSGQSSAVVCAGEIFTPQISSNASSFSWSPTTGVSNVTDSVPQIVGQSSTVYTLTATKGICQKSATITVTVKPLPTVNAGSNQTIVQGDAVQLAATASPGIYEWTPSTGLSSASVLSPLAMPANTTTYHLQVTADGCTAGSDVTINVAPYCVKPMEAFSPNGDGINDLWLVTTGDCLKRAKVEVFNRYGAKVYHNEDYRNNWNGSFEGKLLPDGTYYYIITYQLINGKMVSARGNVTILR